MLRFAIMRSHLAPALSSRSAPAAFLERRKPALSLLANRALANSAAPNGQPPATLRCIPEYYDDGTMSKRPSFWVSNHTSKAINVTLQRFLVPAGSSNWVPGSSIPATLMFQTPRGPTVELQPHEAAFGEADGLTLPLPISISFRIEPSVGEKLSGLREVVKKVETSERLTAARLSSGNTNIPYHVFGLKGGSYRHLALVSTAEILITNATIEPRPRSVQVTHRASSEEIKKARAALRDAMAGESPSSLP